MALQNIRQKSAAAAAVIGLGALLVGCSADARGGSSASFGATGAPLAVSCEPNQRAVVRQVAVNGALQSQVQCETVAAGFAPVGTVGAYGAAPVAYAPAPSVVPASYGYAQPAPLENTRIVRTTYPQEVVTRPAPQRVVYQPARERASVPPSARRRAARRARDSALSSAAAARRCGTRSRGGSNLEIWKSGNLEIDRGPGFIPGPLFCAWRTMRGC